MLDWQGKKAVIIGAARQGIALARYLAAQGARVTVTDRQPWEQLNEARQALEGYEIHWVCGGHPLSLLDQADVLCPSGGVPLTLPLIQEARRRGIPLTNDSQVFLEAAPCPVVGVTGSAGKSTTLSLVGRMAQAALKLENPPYGQVWVGGNIGRPLLADLEQMQPNDLAVVELSSFQLEIMTISPHVAAILNITANHLDRHGTMEAYTAAKANILNFQKQGDTAVLGRDDPIAWGLRTQAAATVWSFGRSPLPAGQNGTYWQDGTVFLRKDGEEHPLLHQEDIALRGEHNRLNVLAACAIAAAAGVPLPALRQGVLGFTGIAHRLQFVRRWGGAEWYNDSIATAPERAMAAIRSFSEPLVLLAGGRDKNLPWGDFAALAAQRVRLLIVFGEAADKILRTFDALSGPKPEIRRSQGLQQAVKLAAELVRPGEVVLLSPGGTSFDEFKDFEERGQWFVKWVNELP